jgi:formylmethanofuran dehydrogenase subunit E
MVSKSATARTEENGAILSPEEYRKFLDEVRAFHGYPAPGVILGAFMVEEAKRHIPEGTLFEALAETAWCLPDAVQMLTPCTIGNGWLKVRNFGRYAVSLFDKHTGEGTRVWLDPARLGKYPELRVWYLKEKPKKEQDTERLLEEIRLAGTSVCGVAPVKVRAEQMEKRSKGAIAVCPLCGEAYPAVHGKVCRPCRGESPYEGDTGQPGAEDRPRLRVVPVGEAVGRRIVHDMTQIEPGKTKDAVFTRGQIIAPGDICRLQRMGRHHLYVEDEDSAPAGEWVHEDEAALAFAQGLAGPGTEPLPPPREGKVNVAATRDGLLLVDKDRLEAFNLIPEVMIATRRDGSLVKAGMRVAGTRAIPLFLRRQWFARAIDLLAQGPLARVAEIRPARVGILVTGTEVAQGIIEDKFEPIVTGKVLGLGGSITRAIIAPDQVEEIKAGVAALLAAGSEIIVTTAGMSVDPDDVTRKALTEAGATDLIYGAPVLPGTMLLLGRVGPARLIGVPACALFFKTTSLDLVLPRVMADVPITRADLAKFGHGGMCMECKSCTFPKCPFGN